MVFEVHLKCQHFIDEWRRQLIKIDFPMNKKQVRFIVSLEKCLNRLYLAYGTNERS